MNNAKFGVFNIGGKDDGVTLNAHLLVLGSDALGIGYYSDSIKGESFGVKFSGKVHATGLEQVKQLFALAGQPVNSLLGAPNIPTLNITLNGIWGADGDANYTVWMDTPVLAHHVGLVNVEWTEA
jgi:hypothetical protein